MSNPIDTYLAHLVDDVEGGRYTNAPSDAGGPTRWGVTLETLREYRHQDVTAADIRDLTRAEAIQIYRDRYVQAPGFDKLVKIDARVTVECIDTGVNMGTATAARFLQRGLNVLNHQGADWPDIRADGKCGPKTVAALKAMKAKRGDEGMRVLLAALNCLQGDRYIQIAESKPSQERWIYGWLANRVLPGLAGATV